MDTKADGGLDERILKRRLPLWRQAKGGKTRWSASLRTRTITSKQTIYALRGYRTYRASRLRSEYSEIEMNLRSVFEHHADEPWFDRASAVQVVEILDSTLPQLELVEPNLDVVADDLGRARRLMVWVTPDDWLIRRAEEVKSLLHASDAPEAKHFKTDVRDHDVMRVRLDEAIAALNRRKTSKERNRGLQVRRLELIRDVGVVALFLLIAFAPILVSGKGLALWERDDLGRSVQAEAWLTTLALGLVGAVGALLSGLLQARTSPVTYADYEVRGIETAVRILVGAAVAVTLYYLFSWQVLPVLAVTSAGTFVLVAFVAGFSERYFLKLLGLDSAAHAADDDPAKRTTTPLTVDRSADSLGMSRPPMPMAPTPA